MFIKAIIQCRMSSHRFPGKVLAPFLGKPILAHIVDCIKRTKINPSIILATSDEKTDDPLATYGKYLGIEVVRGPRDDVLERFAKTLKKHKCDAFFRICGDSPLLIPLLFNQAMSIYKNGSYDLVTNVFPRTFPVGMSVELIKTKRFLETKKKIVKKIDREHLTRYFYQNFKDFQIYNMKCDKSINLNYKLAVDEIKDLKRLESWFLSKGDQYENLFPMKVLK
jgi:spore coat polysaccharide biosynthesis protein SpsF